MSKPALVIPAVHNCRLNLILAALAASLFSCPGCNVSPVPAQYASYESVEPQLATLYLSIGIEQGYFSDDRRGELVEAGRVDVVSRAGDPPIFIVVVANNPKSGLESVFLDRLNWGANHFAISVPRNSTAEFRLDYGGSSSLAKYSPGSRESGHGYCKTLGSRPIGAGSTERIVITLNGKGSAIMVPPTTPPTQPATSQ